MKTIELEKEIQEYCKKQGYTWKAKEIIEEYQKKYSKGFYVSHTCKEVIEHFKSKLEVIERTAEDIMKFIDKFTKIDSYKEIPEKTRLTLYCNGGNFENRGFLENVTVAELGFELLIVESYISQSDLDKLFNEKNYEK